MRTNFDRAFTLTLRYEGGYVDDPKDPGGATNLGVTIGTLSAYMGKPATKADVRALTPAKVKPMYKKRYWDKIMGDALPSGLDLVVYDYAVNSGPAIAAKTLQRIVKIPPDGLIGDDTIEALKGKDIRAIIIEYSRQRTAFLRTLSTFARFGNGWTSRVKHATETACSWVETGALGLMADQDYQEPPLPAAVAEVAGSRACPAEQSVMKTPEGQASLATTIGAIGSAATQAAQQVNDLTSTFAWMKYAFVALTIVGIMAGFYMNVQKARGPDS